MLNKNDHCYYNILQNTSSYYSYLYFITVNTFLAIIKIIHKTKGYNHFESFKMISQLFIMILP